MFSEVKLASVVISSHRPFEPNRAQVFENIQPFQHAEPFPLDHPLEQNSHSFALATEQSLL